MINVEKGGQFDRVLWQAGLADFSLSKVQKVRDDQAWGGKFVALGATLWRR